jgi:hypothetical protein
MRYLVAKLKTLYKKLFIKLERYPRLRIALGKYVIPILVIFVVVMVGMHTLFRSHAATPPHPVVWGGYVAHPQYGAPGFNGVEEQANQLDAKLAVRYYANYPNGCPSSGSKCGSGKHSPAFGAGTEETNLFDGGRIVALSISNGYPVASVAHGDTVKGKSGGTIDSEFSAMFDRMLNLPYGQNGAPNQVWFIYEHEMNAGGVDPASFRAAWIHLYNLYQSRRVALNKPDSVKFVFTPTNALYNYGNVATWWPGDQYVDIVGSDLYNDYT